MDQVSPTSTYRADWYPDPTRRFEFRYHNGQAWTGDVAVDGQRYLDPLLSSYASKPPFEQRGGAGLGRARAAFILGLASVVVGWVPLIAVLTTAAAILALIFGIAVLRRGRSAPGHGFALAGVILAPIGLIASAFGIWLTVVTFREVDDYVNVGNHRVAIEGCTAGDGSARATGSIVNESSETRSYRILLDFGVPGDATVASATAEIDGVEPGRNAEWSTSAIIDIEGGEVTCRVRDVTGPLPFES